MTIAEEAEILIEKEKKRILIYQALRILKHKEVLVEKTLKANQLLVKINNTTIPLDEKELEGFPHVTTYSGDFDVR